MWTLVHTSGAQKGRWKTFDCAENFRMMLDDWWMWETMQVNMI